MLVTSVVKDVLLDGELPGALNLLFHGVLGALAVIGIFAPGRRIQLSIALLAGAGFALYITFLFARL